MNWNMDKPLALLGSMSPNKFMEMYWQKKPLLIRKSIAKFTPLLSKKDLFDLATSDRVQSRLVRQSLRTKKWILNHGPFAPQSLPSVKTKNWTLLVQGVNAYTQSLCDLMRQFRFIPEARLDDLMVSYATKGGGVGPHFDSYDVFLLQANGTRRWRISKQKDLRLIPDMEIKILQNFKPEEEFILEPGDMLYLPPHWAHDGVALSDDCMTYSVGFRTPSQRELACEILSRLADDALDDLDEKMYSDPHQTAENCSGKIPKTLQQFATKSVGTLLKEKNVVARVLGEYLTEPYSLFSFQEQLLEDDLKLLRLNRQTKMLYDKEQIFINGESFLAKGLDAKILRQLADRTVMSGKEKQKLSPAASSIVDEWIMAGWVDQLLE